MPLFHDTGFLIHVSSPGVLKVEDPNHDDFELWSPSEVRDETCLFGRQTLYHRRVRDRDCYIGETLEQPRTVIRNCTCQPSDFEWWVSVPPLLLHYC